MIKKSFIFLPFLIISILSSCPSFPYTGLSGYSDINGANTYVWKYFCSSWHLQSAGSGQINFISTGYNIWLAIFDSTSTAYTYALVIASANVNSMFYEAGLNTFTKAYVIPSTTISNVFSVNFDKTNKKISIYINGINSLSTTVTTYIASNSLYTSFSCYSADCNTISISSVVSNTLGCPVYCYICTTGTTTCSKCYPNYYLYQVNNLCVLCTNNYQTQSGLSDGTGVCKLSCPSFPYSSITGNSLNSLSWQYYCDTWELPSLGSGQINFIATGYDIWVALLDSPETASFAYGFTLGSFSNTNIVLFKFTSPSTINALSTQSYSIQNINNLNVYSVNFNQATSTISIYINGQAAFSYVDSSYKATNSKYFSFSCSSAKCSIITINSVSSNMIGCPIGCFTCTANTVTCANCTSTITNCLYCNANNNACLHCTSNYYLNSNGLCVTCLNSTYPAYYQYGISDGTGMCLTCSSSMSNCLIFNYNVIPSIQQGQTVTITNSMINSFAYAISSILSYTVSGVSNCYFQLNTSIGTPITSFTQTQINNGVIQLVQNGNANNPVYTLQVSDGTNSVSLAATVTFYVLPVVITNQLTIKQGYSVIITNSQINGVDLRLILTYTVTGLTHGNFKIISSGLTITSFTQSQINSSAIMFVQDGSIFPPTYTLTISDGTHYSASSLANITLIPLPLIIVNSMTIKQGKTVVLTSSMLRASGGTDLTLTFSVINFQYIIFALVTAPQTSIISFTQTQINNGTIEVIHDGSLNTPTYTLQVTDGSDSSTISLVSLNFVKLPTLTMNQMSLKQGMTVTITAANMDGTVNLGLPMSFVISSVQHGTFQLTTNQGVSITSFTTQQVNANLVQFIHDGTISPPSYNLQVSDGTDLTPVSLVTITNFKKMPTITINQFVIEQGTSIFLYNDILNGTADVGFTVRNYTVSNVNYCHFETFTNPGFSIIAFTPAQINSKQIILFHDGSINPPSFILIISDGFDSSSTNANITFIMASVMLANQMTIIQGSTIVLNTTFLNAITYTNTTPTFFISNLKHGYFKLSSDLTNTAINTFSLTQIINGQISFVQDGTLYPPIYQVSLSDGKISTTPINPQINFIPRFTLINNLMKINQAQTVLITLLFLNASSMVDDGQNIIFTITNLIHAKFVLTATPQTSITSFTLKQIINNQISFTQDSSPFAPSYSVSIGDGILFTEPIGAAVTFNNVANPIIIKNTMTINQGQAVILTNANLLTNPVDINNKFTITNVSNGNFNFLIFLQSDLNSNIVQFTHDNTVIAPQYCIIITNPDGLSNGVPYCANILFSAKPTLVTNQLSINKGQRITLTLNMFSASDLYYSPSFLIFYPINVLNGQFELITSPGNPITSFFQIQIEKNQVVFVHDGSENAPIFKISVGNGAITIDAQPTLITFVNPKGVCGLIDLNQIQTNQTIGLDLTSDNNYLITAQLKGIVNIYDIRDYNNIGLIAQINLNSNNNKISNLNRLKIINDYVLVTSNDATLAIINIQNINSPTLIGSVGGSNTINDITICNNYAYLAGGSDGVHIISISDVSHPTYVKSMNLGVVIVSCFCLNNTLFLLSGAKPGIIYVLDTTIPDSPIFNTAQVANLTVSDIGNYIISKGDGKTAFVGTNAGIDIVDISNPLNLTIINSIIIDTILYITITVDDVYIGAVSEQTVTIINIQSSQNPVILDTLSYSFKLNEVILNGQITYGIISTNEILQVFIIFKGVQSRLSPSLAYNNTLSINNNIGINNYIVATSDNKDYFISNTIQGIFVLEYQYNSFHVINAIPPFLVGTSITTLILSNVAPFLYVISNAGLIILDVTNASTPLVQAGLNMMNGAWGIALSKSIITQQDDYAYITNNLQKSLNIVSISDFSKILLISSLNLNGNAKMIGISNDGNTAVIIYEGTGFAIVNVTLKTKPTILYETNDIGDVRSLILYSTSTNQYIIISMYTEGTISIYDITDLIYPPVLVGSRYIGMQTMGIALSPNNNYIVVQSYNKLSFVEIRDVTNPIIVNVIKDTTLNSSYYQMTIITEYIALPTFSLYIIYSQKTSFYYSLTAITYLGGKIFTCKLYPVDPISLDKSTFTSSLLDVQIDGSWPYWMTASLKDLTVTITPPDFNSLIKLRNLILTYTTQIQYSEFYGVSAGKSGDDVYNILLNSGIIDINRLILPGYDPNSILPLDISFNATNIKLLLNQHYLQTNVNFNLNDFLSLDNAPILGSHSLQFQFDSYGSQQINQLINFAFDSNTFIDPDGDSLTYSVNNLPNWLQFYPSSQKFLGTPTKYNLGTYRIQVFASDGYKNLSDSFTITIAKQRPLSTSTSNQNFTLGFNYDWSLPASSFMDPDKDPLSFSAFAVNSSGTQVNLPNWLNFDSSRLRLYGTPGIIDVAYDNITRRFYQEFDLKIVATDIADQKANTQFSLYVINYSPSLNPSLTINDQFTYQYGQYLKVNQEMSFELSSQTFIDPDNSVLYYTTSNMPNWLSFSGMKFHGIPSKNDLGNYTIIVTCSDGLSNVSDSFFISVQNHPPIANTLNNQTFILGQKYSYSLPGDTFSNPENILLSYNAYIINNNGSIEPLPLWLTFDNTRLIFAGEPYISDISYDAINKRYYEIFNIEVYVKDAASVVVSSNFSLTVTNSAPIANTSQNNQNFTLGSNYDWSLPISDFTDPDKDTLSFSAFVIDSNGIQKNLPNWLNFDSSRLRLYGSPTKTDIFYDNLKRRFYQQFTIEIVATDVALQTANLQFILTVINYSPNLNPSQTLNGQFSYQFGNYIKVNQVIDFEFSPATFIDPDNSALTYTVNGMPAWMVFSVMKFHGIPTKDDIQSYNIMVTCTDGLSSISDNFLIKVENHPPVAKALNDQQFTLGQKYSYYLPSDTFTNPEEINLIYSSQLAYDNGTLGNLPSWLTFDTSRRLFDGFPLVSDINFDIEKKRYYQRFNISISVTDQASVVVSSSFSLIVQNYAPTIAHSFENATYTLGKSITYNFPTNAFIDIDGDVLTYQALLITEDGSYSNLPNWLTFDQNKYVFQGTPSTSDINLDSINKRYYQEFYIEITATDLPNSNSSASFCLIVENTAPKSKGIVNATFILGSSLTFTIPSDTFYDIDGDTLTYQIFFIYFNFTNNESILTNIPTWLTFDTNRLLLQGNPSNDNIYFDAINRRYLQKFDFIVFATDLPNSNISSTFALTIQNIPPQVNPNKTLANQFASITPQVEMYIEFNFDSDTFIDKNNGTLNYDVRIATGQNSNNKRLLVTNNNVSANTEPIPTWMQFDKNLRKLSMTPPDTALNLQYTAVVTADNGVLVESQQFSFYVTYSWSYILLHFVKFSGLIVSVFGAWVYRVSLYAFLFKKHYKYPEYEELFVNEIYEKKIYLLKRDIEIADILWKSIKKRNKKMKWSTLFMNNEFLTNEIIVNLKEIGRKNIFNEKDIIIGGRIYEIIQGFMSFQAIKEYPRAKIIFEKIKSKLEKEYMKSWYKELVSISYITEEFENSRDIFPTISIKTEILENLIKQYRFDQNKRNLKIFSEEDISLENKLINAMVKCYALGIPPNPLRFYEMEYSRGESMFLEPGCVCEIQYKQIDDLQTTIKGKWYEFPRSNNYPKIPEWLKYEIKHGILIFYGKPTFYERGQYAIRIYNSQGLIMREFGIDIQEANEKANSNSLSCEFNANTPQIQESGMLVNCSNLPLNNKKYTSMIKFKTTKLNNKIFPTTPTKEGEENKNDKESVENKQQSTKAIDDLENLLKNEEMNKNNENIHNNKKNTLKIMSTETSILFKEKPETEKKKMVLPLKAHEEKRTDRKTSEFNNSEENLIKVYNDENNENDHPIEKDNKFEIKNYMPNKRNESNISSKLKTNTEFNNSEQNFIKSYNDGKKNFNNENDNYVEKDNKLVIKNDMPNKRIESQNSFKQKTTPEFNNSEKNIIKAYNDENSNVVEKDNKFEIKNDIQNKRIESHNSFKPKTTNEFNNSEKNLIKAYNDEKKNFMKIKNDMSNKRIGSHNSFKEQENNKNEAEKIELESFNNIINEIVSKPEKKLETQQIELKPIDINNYEENKTNNADFNSESNNINYENDKLIEDVEKLQITDIENQINVQENNNNVTPPIELNLNMNNFEDDLQNIINEENNRISDKKEIIIEKEKNLKKIKEDKFFKKPKLIVHSKDIDEIPDNVYLSHLKTKKKQINLKNLDSSRSSRKLSQKKRK